jgi:hypothetical protein
MQAIDYRSQADKYNNENIPKNVIPDLLTQVSYASKNGHYDLTYTLYIGKLNNIQLKKLEKEMEMKGFNISFKTLSGETIYNVLNFKRKKFLKKEEDLIKVNISW